MLKLRIYFVRHAETEANKANILQGHCDFPLTEEGVEQSIEAGKKLKNIEWARILTSDLDRASRTCEIILSQSETVVDKTDFSKIHHLRELSFGVKEGLDRDTPVEEAKSIKAKQLNLSIDDIEHNPETPNQVLERQKLFFLHLFEECSEFIGSNNLVLPNVLCVSHSALIKRFLMNFCDLESSAIKLANCSMSIVDIVYDSKDQYKCTYQHLFL